MREPYGGIELHDEHIRVPVQDQPWEPVALTIDQPISVGVGSFREACAPVNCVHQQTEPEVRFDRLRLAVMQNPYADRRVGIKQPNSQKVAILVEDDRQVAGSSVVAHRLNRLVEDPWVPGSYMSLSRRSNTKCHPFGPKLWQRRERTHRPRMAGGGMFYVVALESVASAVRE